MAFILLEDEEILCSRTVLAEDLNACLAVRRGCEHHIPHFSGKAEIFMSRLPEAKTRNPDGPLYLVRGLDKLCTVAPSRLLGVP